MMDQGVQTINEEIDEADEQEGPEPEEDEEEVPDLVNVEENEDPEVALEMVFTQQPFGANRTWEFWMNAYDSAQDELAGVWNANTQLQEEAEALMTENERLTERNQLLEARGIRLSNRIEELQAELTLMWRTGDRIIPSEITQMIMGNSRRREAIRSERRLETYKDTNEQWPEWEEDERRLDNIQRPGEVISDEALELDRLQAMRAERDREYRPALNPREEIRPKREYKCLTAYMMINGMEGLTLFNSGSSIDAVSNEFARVANMNPEQLEKPVPLQLGTTGSRSVINFGTKTSIRLGHTTTPAYFDVMNLDHYDLIMGVPLMVQLGICLDFGDDTIKMKDGTIVPSLKIEEERSNTRRPRPNGRNGERGKRNGPKD